MEVSWESRSIAGSAHGDAGYEAVASTSPSIFAYRPRASQTMVNTVMKRHSPVVGVLFAVLLFSLAAARYPGGLWSPPIPSVYSLADDGLPRRSHSGHNVDLPSEAVQHATKREPWCAGR